jgi:hypothetical protein
MIESTTWRHVDVDLLRRGIEVAQCYSSAGFSPAERVRVGRRRLPLAVHAMGPKPWSVLGAHQGSADFWLRTHMQLTPYTALAARYASRLPDELGWTTSRTAVARLLARVAEDDPVLQEFPLALAQWPYWRLRQAAGRLRHRSRS